MVLCACVEDESRQAPLLVFRLTACKHFIAFITQHCAFYCLNATALAWTRRGRAVGLTLQLRQVQLLDFCSSYPTGLHIYSFIILFYDCNNYVLFKYFIC